MFLVNILDYMLTLEIIKYIFVAFAFLGVMLLVRKVTIGD